jgi:hypothetical protein
LVERNLAKVEVESSRLFSRSRFEKEVRKDFLFFVLAQRYTGNGMLPAWLPEWFSCLNKNVGTGCTSVEKCV